MIKFRASVPGTELMLMSKGLLPDMQSKPVPWNWLSQEEKKGSTAQLTRDRRPKPVSPVWSNFLSDLGKENNTWTFWVGRVSWKGFGAWAIYGIAKGLQHPHIPGQQAFASERFWHSGSSLCPCLWFCGGRRNFGDIYITYKKFTSLDLLTF